MVNATCHFVFCAIVIVIGLGRSSAAATEPLAGVPIEIGTSSWRLGLSWVHDEASGVEGDRNGSLVNPSRHPRFELTAIRLPAAPANDTPLALASWNPPPISRVGVLDTLDGSGSLRWDADAEVLYLVTGTSLHEFLYMHVYKIRLQLNGDTIALSTQALTPIGEGSLDERSLRRRNAAPLV